MDSAELRGVLRDAGLSKYQSLAYTTLLGLGTASATELANASDVPAARIYDVLRDLEDRGYVETYESDSLRARAGNPAEVLTDLRSRSERLTAAAEEIERRWEAPALDHHRVDIVKRFETVFEHAASAIEGATTEVQVAVTPEGFETLRDSLATAKANGAVVKVSIHTQDETASLPTGYEDAATEIRHRTLPTPFVAIVDRTTTCFAPHRRSINEYGVLVEDFSLTYVFRWYFDTSLWEVWDVVYDDRATDPPIVYANLRRFVRDVQPLLAEGFAVEATVEGSEVGTGRAVTVAGEIVDVVYSGDSRADGEIPIGQLAGQVTVELDDGERRVSVGGWGAVVEDVEATRLTITGIDDPTDVAVGGIDA
ncbi:TrmB family transcriptional regulator [Halorubrum vacuolatum]|uniref:Transcriptional regulator n=1 Tax=Halorubrum vacuolatum TaxID=63740 RepID=A0A238WXN5_HALVU|nr:TrmB family transcriptional regulator [Halorubrum vacuolatum]SNR51238.1 transcriptional regulator [Halorubrum vacuolatum]